MKKRYRVIFLCICVLMLVFGALIYALAPLPWESPSPGQADEPYYLTDAPIVIGDTLDNLKATSKNSFLMIWMRD